MSGRRLTAAEAAAQRAGATRIALGIWTDRSGDPHFSVPELLELFGWEDTPAERAEVTRILKAVLAERFPGVEIIEQEEGGDR